MAEIIEFPTKNKILNEPYLEFISKTLSEEDMKDIEEAILSKNHYDNLDDELKIFVDKFFNQC